MPFQLVDDERSLERELSRLDTATIGIDVERADAQQYFRSPALIQIGSDTDCVLIDSLNIATFQPVNTFVAARDTLVLHAGENDYEPLEAKGIVLGECEDTAVAASLLGLPGGLGTLLRDLLAIDTPNKNRFQRADWAKRPLSRAMLEYAASDVIHLPRLWGTLRDELIKADRLAWYEEERRRVRERAAMRERSVTKLRGAGSLAPNEKAVLHAIWEAREAHAREHDIAPNFLVHDDVLLTVSRTPPESATALAALLPKRDQSQAFARTMFAAVTDGQSRPPVLRDSQRIVIDDTVHDALKQARSAVAKEIGIDAGVLAPATALKQALSQPVHDGEEILQHAGLAGWRTPLLKDALWEAYRAANDRLVSEPDSPAN